MRLYTVLLFHCILISSLLAQNTSTSEIKKNIISIEGETFGFWGNATINFERIFRAGQPLRVSLRGGFGRYYIVECWDCGTDTGPMYKISTSLIWRLPQFFQEPIWDYNRSSHPADNDWSFEISLGLNSPPTSYLPDFEKNWPLINLGLRYEVAKFRGRIYLSFWGAGMSLGFAI